MTWAVNSSRRWPREHSVEQQCDRWPDFVSGMRQFLSYVFSIANFVLGLLQGATFWCMVALYFAQRRCWKTSGRSGPDLGL
eukprot:9499815-Pyramimonas_sp.AAC.1